MARRARTWSFVCIGAGAQLLAYHAFRESTALPSPTANVLAGVFLYSIYIYVMSERPAGLGWTLADYADLHMVSYLALLPVGREIFNTCVGLPSDSVAPAAAFTLLPLLAMHALTRCILFSREEIASLRTDRIQHRTSKGERAI